MAKQSESEKKKEDWMNSKWRPMMGWMYMAVCTFDFVVAPVLWSLVQALAKGSVNVQWQPLTLQGAGLFHIAMGAVLGIAAHGRTQEKLNGANNGGLNLPGNAGTTYTPPAPVAQQPTAAPTPAGGFGSAPAGFPSQPPVVTQSWGAQPIATTASGKKIVPAADDPLI